MAADYEHSRTVKHAISVLLIVAWCGITYIGTSDCAITHDLKHHEIDMLGLPVCGIGCTMQHHNHKNQWKKINCREIAVIDRALVFLAQTKNVDDAKICKCTQQITPIICSLPAAKMKSQNIACQLTRV